MGFSSVLFIKNYQRKGLEIYLAIQSSYISLS